MDVFSRLFTEKHILKSGYLHKIKNEMLQKCSTCATSFSGTPPPTDGANPDSSTILTTTSSSSSTSHNLNVGDLIQESKKRKRSELDCEALNILCK